MCALLDNSLLDVEILIDAEVIITTSNKPNIFRLGIHVFEVISRGVRFIKDLKGITFDETGQTKAICRQRFSNGLNEITSYCFIGKNTNAPIAAIQCYHGYFTYRLYSCDGNEKEKQKYRAIYNDNNNERRTNPIRKTNTGCAQV